MRRFDVHRPFLLAIAAAFLSVLSQTMFSSAQAADANTYKKTVRRQR